MRSYFHRESGDSEAKSFIFRWKMGNFVSQKTDVLHMQLFFCEGRNFPVLGGNNTIMLSHALMAEINLGFGN